MTPLYIIPARGGSKGIPHKNIKPLGGRPLIAYAIDGARGAGADDRHIILSTDDPAIAETARSLGLPVPYMRPAALATDTAGSREVILDAMDWADSQGIAYDCVVLLQPTSPFRTPGDILGAIAAYTPGADMVVSVCESTSNPYYNLFETDAEGYLNISKGDGFITRRQDAPRVWEYNGAVYVINPQSIRTMAMGAFRRRIPYVMPAERSVDLDTPADWLIAETMLAANQSQRQMF
ncbi:MAG: acylneuraminate cytidylyltransferase family protein [Muribaculaceae bacterium]|nr:acylneuraminate cytidylyltransferase family protein [Muribaculaceae bacterium]